MAKERPQKPVFTAKNGKLEITRVIPKRLAEHRLAKMKVRHAKMDDSRPVKAILAERIADLETEVNKLQ